MSNQLQVTGTAIFSAAGQSIKLTSASDVYLNVTRGSSILNIGIDATGSFYNTSTSHRFFTNSGTINALTIASTGAATFSSSVTAGGSFISNVNNGYGLRLNRAAVTNFNGISHATAGVERWFVGMRENLSSNNYVIYNEATGVDVMTLSSSNNNVGIGTSSPYALLSVYSGSAGDRILIDSLSGSGSNGAIAWGAGSVPNISARIKGIDDGFYGTHLLFETRGNAAIGTTTTERMRITSIGNVLIGTTTDNGARLQINGTSNFTGNLTINDGSLIKLGQGGSSNVSINFFASNFGAGYEGRIMGLNSDGNTHFYSRNGSATFTDIGYFSNTGMYITYYGTYSDMRLKNLIETNPDINLDGLDVIKYTLKSNPSLIRYGYSAQQVQSILPDLVTLNKKIDGNEEDATLMLNYNDLYVLKIAALEKKMAELMQEVAVLKGKNN